MKQLLYTVIQCTWGAAQTLVGAVAFLLHLRCPHQKYRCAVVTAWDRTDSISLGMFLFIGHGEGKRILKHEYGHSIQSLILGPLYLPVIGIPSFLWCNVPFIGRKWRSGKVSYFSVFQERWADRLGFARELIPQQKKAVNQTADSTLSQTADSTLNQTADLILRQTADSTLSQTADSTLRQTAGQTTYQRTIC